MMQKKNFGLFLLVCFTLTLLSGCSKNKEEQALEYVNSARNYLSKNMPETAVIEYRNAININPEDGRIHFELAETYIQLRQLNQAIKYYKSSARLNSADPLPLLRLAQIHLHSDRLLEARDYVDKVFQISPTSVEAHHILSSIQIKERDLTSAIETLNKAVTIDPKNIKTHLSLAQLYLKTKQTQKAKDIYLAAIAQDPTSREAYMGLIKLYAFEKRLDKVEELLLSALETDGDKVLQYTDLARFYEGQKKYELSEEYYQKALMAGQEGDVVPLMNLAEFYTKRNFADKAIVTMKNAVSRKKNDPVLLSRLSQIYLHFKMEDKALETINQALAINKDFVDGLFQKGRVMMAKEEYAQALDLFDQVIALDKINASAYYYRALCIKQKGATDRPEQKIFRAAMGMLDKPEEFEKDQIKGNLLAAITVDPNLVEARIKLTEIYITEKNLIKAREQIEKIFSLTPPSIKTMTLLAGVYVLEGNFTEAEKILNVIIEEKPEYIPAYIRLGLLYRATNRTKESIELFEKAYGMDTNQIGVVKMISNTLLTEKKPQKALETVERLSAKSDEVHKAFFDTLIGEILLRLDRKKEAIQRFENAKKLKPDYIRPYMYTANFLRIENRLMDALREYQAVEKINPDFVPALFAIGTIFDLQGNVNQAEKYYRKVIELNPDHIDATNNLAYILAGKPESLEEAFRLAKKAREKMPKDPNVLDTMGWIFYQKGNYLNALSELEESLSINPDSALATYHYGMALYQTKKYEEARKYLKKALEMDPGFDGAENARKILN